MAENHLAINYFHAAKALRGRDSLDPILAFRCLHVLSSECKYRHLAEAAKRTLKELGFESVECLRPCDTEE